MAEDFNKIIFDVEVNADTSDLKDAKKEIKSVGDETKKLENQDVSQPFVSLRAQLRQARNELGEMISRFGETSKEAANAAKKVATIKDQIENANIISQQFNPDLKFKSLAVVAKTGAAALQGVGGAMVALGVNSENAQEAMAKLQGVMAFSSFLNEIDDLVDMWKGYAASVEAARKIQEAKKDMSIQEAAANTAVAETVVAGTAATTESTVATEAHTVATEGQAAATETAAVATKGLGAAFKALGIGAIIGAIILLIDNWDKLTDALGFTTKAQREFESASKDAVKAEQSSGAKEIENVEKVRAAFDEAKKGIISKKQALETYNDTLGDSFGKTNDLATAERNLNSKAEAYIQATMLKAKANIYFQKSAEATAKGMTAAEEDQVSMGAKLWSGVQAFFGNYGGAALTTANSQLEGVKTVQNETDKVAKKFQDAGTDLLKQADGLATKYGFSLDKTKKDTKDAVDKNLHEFDRFEEGLKEHYQLMEQAVNEGEKRLRDAQMSQRDKEINDAQFNYDEQVKKITDAYQKDVTALNNAFKEKRITQEQYNKGVKDLNDQKADMDKAVVTLTEQKNKQILAIEKKYADQTDQFLLEHSEDELQKKIAQIKKSYEEQLKNTENDPNRKALLQARMDEEINQAKREDASGDVVKKAETQFITTQVNNTIGEFDSPEAITRKMTAVFNAAKIKEQSEYEDKKLRAKGNDVELENIEAQHNANMLTLKDTYEKDLKQRLKFDDPNNPESLENVRLYYGQLESQENDHYIQQLQTLMLHHGDVEAAEKAHMDRVAELHRQEAEDEQSVNRMKLVSTLGFIEQGAQILEGVSKKNKALNIAAFAIEKGAAIAGIVVKTQEELANYGKAMSAEMATNAEVAAPYGPAGPAVLAIMNAKTSATFAKRTIASKVRAGLSIASIAATSIDKFTNGGSGGNTSSGEDSGSINQSPNISATQVIQQPQDVRATLDKNVLLKAYIPQDDLITAAQKQAFLETLQG